MKKLNSYFDECENCLYKEHNDDLWCCLTNRLSLAWHKLLLELPIISKFIDNNRHCYSYQNIDDYRYCHHYEE